MSAGQSVLGQLRLLLERGAIPASQCGRATMQALRPLLHSGVLAEERAGSGRRISVRQADGLRAFIAHQFPLETSDPATVNRVAGVARFRDSKALPGNTPEVVLARAWDFDSLLLGNRSAGAATATSQHGVFAFVLNRSHDYRPRGAVALVENPAFFLEFEKLALPVPMVLLSHGCASQQLVDWLASTPASDCSFVHFPDYDPAGLMEHRRLRQALGERVSLHVPTDLPELFQRFANRNLLTPLKSQSALADLRGETDPATATVLGLIQQHNAGLEQEALLAALATD